MKQIEDKKDDSEGPEGFLPASPDYNNHKNELQNPVTQSGQNFDDKTTDQTGIAMANYASISTFYIDSGSPNSYILSATALFKSPHQYVNGMLIAFIPLNTNTGNCVVKVTALASVPLLNHFGGQLQSGHIQKGKIYTARYLSGSFLLDDAVNYYPRFKTGLNVFQDPGNPTTHLRTEVGSTTTLENDLIVTNTDNTFSKDATATWAAGTGNGGLAATVIPPVIDGNLDYFMLSDNQGNIDFGYDSPGSNAANLLATAAVVTAGFTKASFLTQWVTNVTGNLKNLINIGSFMLYDEPYPIVNFFGAGIAGSLQPVTLSVALGRRVEAIISYGKLNSTNTTSDGVSVMPFDYLVPPVVPYAKWDFGIIVTVGVVQDYSLGRMEKVITNNLGQLKYFQYANTYGAGGGLFLHTYGWKELYWG